MMNSARKSVDPLGRLVESLEGLRRADLLRFPRVRRNRQGPVIDLDGRPCVNFGSNDYLGLAGDSRYGGWGRSVAQPPVSPQPHFSGTRSQAACVHLGHDGLRPFTLCAGRFADAFDVLSTRYPRGSRRGRIIVEESPGKSKNATRLARPAGDAFRSPSVSPNIYGMGGVTRTAPEAKALRFSTGRMR